MKKLYLSSLLVLLNILLFAGNALAQGIPTYSTTIGASGNAFPLQTTSSNRVQNIYQPTLFTGTIIGNITKIYIQANTATAGGTFTDLTISIGNTSLSAFTVGPFVTGLTPVYYAASTTYPALAAGDWFSVTLQTPFLYTGASNIIIDVSQSAYTGSGIQVRYNGSGGARLWGPYNGAATGTGAGPFNVGFDMLPSAPCTSPPTAGTTVVSATNICSGGPLNLNLTGNSYGSGQSYQWQTSPTLTGTYTNLGPLSTGSPFYATTATATQYYRAAVTCGTSTTYSTPMLVTVPGLFPGGTYTINGTLPASATNFQTFAAAVSAVSCGTSGPIIFNVNNATYNEQVTIPVINTNSAVNTITFNGNGATLTYAGTASAMHTFGLNGADWIRVNNLNIVGTDVTNALVGHLWNGADNNKFDACTFTGTANTTSSYSVPFSISGSATSATLTGLGGNNNLMNGCTMNNGYYNTCIVGITGTLSTGNQLVNCTMKDFYFYGIYNYYSDGTVISGNDISRPTRTTLSTYYGCYITTGCVNILIEKNKFHDPFATAETGTNSGYLIYALTSSVLGSENKIINNIFYNLKTNGSLYCIYTSAYNYYQIYHNTINVDDASATGGLVYGIYNTGTLGVDIRDNIVNITKGGTGTKYCLYYSGAKTSNNNDLYITPASTNYTGYYAGNQITLANFQAASGMDAASVSVDPVFTSPAAGNLKPTNIGMDNLGTSVGVATDITNLGRLNPPDIGAYEFGSGCPSVTGLAVTGITSSGATFSWTAPPGGAGGYQYVIDYSINDPVVPGTVVTAATLTRNNLLPFTSYYYHVRVVCPGGGFSFWSTIAFNTPCKIPSGALRLSGDSVLCPNQPITLSTDTAYAVTYQWKLNGVNIPGATTANYSTGTNGAYSVVSTQGTCTKTSATVNLTTDTTLTATVTYSGTSTTCEGGHILLRANTGVGFSYQWIKNGSPVPTANSSTYTADYSGIYQVRITSSARCPALSNPIAVVVYPAPFPQITRNGADLSTTKSYATYQWYKGVLPISGATSATYTITNDGSYNVRVTDTNGCTSGSASYPVNFLSIGTASASDISIYPNPATDVITVSAPVPVSVTIRSIDGKLIMQQDNASTIDIHELSGGMYLLSVSDKEGHVLKLEKLIKSSH